MPEQVAHEESQLASSIASFIVTGVSISFEATGVFQKEKRFQF